MSVPAPVHPPAAERPRDPAGSAAKLLLVAAVMLLVGTVSKSWFSAKPQGAEVSLGLMGAEVCWAGTCMDAGNLDLPDIVEPVMALGMLGGFASMALAALYGGLWLANRRDKLLPAKLGITVFMVTGGLMLLFVLRIVAEGGKDDTYPSWAIVPGLGGAILAAIQLRRLAVYMPAPAHTAPGAYGPGYGPPGQPGYGQAPQGYGQPHAQQSQPMQPYGAPHGQPNQQSQPMAPYGQPNQPSQPMQPHGAQPPHAQPQQPYAQPYAQPNQPQPQPQPYGVQQPQAPQAPHGAQPAAPACPRCATPLQFVAQYQRWFCPREQQYL